MLKNHNIILQKIMFRIIWQNITLAEEDLHLVKNLSDQQQQLNCCCIDLLIYFVSLNEIGTEFYLK